MSGGGSVAARRSWRWPLVAIALLGPAMAFAAPEAPAIREIAFAGNAATDADVLRRELLVAVGEPADPERIEQSRQALLDLGLFRDVRVAREEVDDGVRLTFEVREKWYLLPYPRLGANTDGQYTYGGEVRWNNAWGLNHVMKLRASVSDRREPGREKETAYLFAYRAPFVWDSPYAVELGAQHTVSPVVDPLEYDETFDRVSLLVSRGLGSSRRASHGWMLGGGVQWQNQDTSGPSAPAPFGHATALVGTAEYRDLRYRVYSEDGLLFQSRLELAAEGVASDYGYGRLTAEVLDVLPIGGTPHQVVELRLSGGANTGDNPPRASEFGLGGTLQLRGFPRDFVKGSFFYVASAEYLRPVFRDWMRLGVILEAGNAAPKADDLLDHCYVSAGVGIRLRVTRLVDFDFELGYAVPLAGDGQRGRFYGDRVRN